MIAAAIKVEAVVQVLAPNVAALDAYKAAIESKVERALPAPSRTRTDKATGVRCVSKQVLTRIPVTVAREGGEA